VADTAKDRWAARAGWNLTASRVNKGADGLDLPVLLDRIEKEMPKAMPDVQWTMNNTLGAIGIHDPKLRKRARKPPECWTSIAPHCIRK
jgi:hypothetical protein